MKDLIEIVSALGLGGIVTKLFGHFLNKRKEKMRRKRGFGSVFNKMHEVYKTLQLMLNESKAHRILVLKTTNGGGKPKLSSELYSSVLFEAYEHPLESMRDSWQRQRLDKDYINMLNEMDKEGFLWLHTDRMPEGMLKDLYKAHKLTGSLVCRLAEKETEYVYISVNFTDPIDESPEFKEVMREGLTRLRSIFQNTSFPPSI